MCALQQAGRKGYHQRAAPCRRPNLSTRQRAHPGCIAQYESFVRKQLAAAYEAVAERTLDTSVAAYQTRQAVRIAEEEQPPKARPKRPRKAPMSQLEGLMATAGPAPSRPAAVSFFGCRHLWAQLGGWCADNAGATTVLSAYSKLGIVVLPFDALWLP